MCRYGAIGVLYAPMATNPGLLFVSDGSLLDVTSLVRFTILVRMDLILNG